MRRISLLCVTCAAAMMVAGGCASMSGTLKGGLIGGGGGTAVGAGIGALAGGGKGAAIGAGVGLALGATAGALIGRKMEKQKAELAAIEGAEVETVTDTNGLDAIKVTFDTGILFPTNGTALNASAKAALDKFAISLLQNPDTDVTVFGHTDSTGTLAVNERISLRTCAGRSQLFGDERNRLEPLPQSRGQGLYRAGRLERYGRGPGGQPPRRGLYLGRPGDDPAGAGGDAPIGFSAGFPVENLPFFVNIQC